MDLVSGFPVDDNKRSGNSISECESNKIGSGGSDEGVVDKLGSGGENGNGLYGVEIKNGSCDEVMKREGSGSPTTVKKGVGLRKWRRIRRDVTRSGGDSGGEGVRNVMPDVMSPGVSSSKRVQVYSERSPKGEGSASSTRALIKSLDGYGFLGEGMEGIGKSFAAGTDSENSEDRSSKSSTAASAPRVRYERPVVSGGSVQGKSFMSGKNLTQSTQRVQQGKSRSETTKKARGERVKIEKENSQSSLDSDLRSSGSVFKQDNHSLSNGMTRERRIDYDREIYDEVQGSEYQDTDGVRGGYRGDDDRGYEDVTAEGVVGDSPWDQDPMNDPLCILKSLEEALEKEVLKFKEIGKDVEEKLHEADSVQLPSGEAGKSSSHTAQLATANSDVERVSEDIIKQKIEAEVEGLVISAMLEKLRVTTTDQITLFEEQKSLASQQTQMLDKLGDAEDRAVVLKKEAEKLERHCEDIAVADETLMLQSRVCKYSSCFFLQLIIFLVVIGVFLSELSPPVDLIPT